MVYLGSKKKSWGYSGCFIPTQLTQLLGKKGKHVMISSMSNTSKSWLVVMIVATIEGPTRNIWSICLNRNQTAQGQCNTTSKDQSLLGFGRRKVPGWSRLCNMLVNQLPRSAMHFLQGCWFPEKMFGPTVSIYVYCFLEILQHTVAHRFTIKFTKKK